MSLGMVFLFFFLWRVVDFLVVFFAPRFIPYLGFFPYKDILASYHLPEFITKLANFDGVHYLLIAQNGYQQYQQAFFPLYPYLIRYLSPIFFHNPLLSGFFISNFCFFLGLYFFYRYLLLLKIEQKSAKRALILLLFFPTSFFFGAIYTEGLFFLLVSLTLYFLEKNHPARYFFVAIFSFFASLTRLAGIFLIILIIFFLLKEKKNKKKLFINHYSLLFFPLFGLVGYSFYLWQTTGDPLFFFHSQVAFGANRSTKLILLPQVYWRYLKILFQADFNWQYFVSLTELIIFTFVLAILIFELLKITQLKHNQEKKLKAWQIENYYSFSILNFQFRILDLSRFSLNLFSIGNLLLSTFTGTFSSIPRYALLSLSFYIFLSQLNNKRLFFFLLLIFLIFHLILLAYFSQGYFVS